MSDAMLIARAIAHELPMHGCTGRAYSTVGGAVLLYLRDALGNDQGRISVAADGSVSGRHIPPDRQHVIGPARAVAARFR